MNRMKLCLLAVLTFGQGMAEAAFRDNPTEMTTSIVNPSFEDGVTGWANAGFWTQTNDSPTGEGWTKDGKIYMERWVADSQTLPDADLHQVVSELPVGVFKVVVDAHAVNQKGEPEVCQGAFLYAGRHETSVHKGGEYQLRAVAVNGTLEIGFRLKGTDANWAAVDHFRLLYEGHDVEAYKEELDILLAVAEEGAAQENCHNLTSLRKAIETAKETGDSVDELVAALQGLDAAINEYDRLAVQYGAFERALLNAKKLYDGSDYAGKSLFGKVIEELEPLADNPEGQDLMEAVSKLEKATQDYLDTRPSNWMTIRNGALWVDDRGEPVQAHGAGFLQVGDTWYMIGEDRNNTWNPDVNMYSTKDFVHWKFERKIIKNGVTHPSLGNGRFIERPKLMYCRKTGKYVVWCHWEQGNYGASEAAVFYCDSVNGDYKFHWAGRPLGVKSRDCNVFVDNDGTAYFISTIEENQHLGLFRLSDDYLSAVEYTELFKWQSREAPAIVRHGDTYFMMFSACSGWDPNQASYSYSKSLTSGWSSRANIGNSVAYDTQAASVLTVTGSKGTSYMYVGDRWQDPGLAESKTIMFPISFNGNSIVFDYKPQFDLDLSTGQCRDVAQSCYVPKDKWKVRAFSSQETGSENGAAANAIDGNLQTKWHTRYSGGVAPAPHHIEVDMGEEHEIAGFLCAPRMDNSSNGLVRDYMFLVSTDGEQWEAVSGGTWLPYYAGVYFEPVKARYFRLVALAGQYASISEIDILQEAPDSFAPASVNGSWRLGESSPFYNTNPTVRKRSTVTLTAKTGSSGGSWAFYGPDGEMGHTNEYRIDKVSDENVGVYTFIYSDQYCQSAKVDFQLSIRGTDVESVESGLAVVDTKYYTLQGMEVSEPLGKGIYVVKTCYGDGIVKVEKKLLD